MKIIKLLKKKEYIITLILIIIDLLIKIVCHDFFPNKIKKSIIFFYSFVIIFHFLVCIFLESEFNRNYLILLQIRFEKYISFISLIAICSIYVNISNCYFFFNEYFDYKTSCPFFLQHLDYKLHLKRRCELYNINHEKPTLQYICSYNADQLPILSLIVGEIFNITDKYIYCKLNKSLIVNNDNEVINKFVKEYYKEDIYFCDLIKKPMKYPISINPKICQSPTIDFSLVIIPHFFLVLYYIYLNFVYFKNIRANINNKIITRNDILLYNILINKKFL